VARLHLGPRGGALHALQDLRLHVRAWQHHFPAIFGLEALGRVRGFSPAEMALPNHPDVACAFVRIPDCGYQWVLVQERTAQQPDGCSICRTGWCAQTRAADALISILSTLSARWRTACGAQSTPASVRPDPPWRPGPRTRSTRKVVHISHPIRTARCQATHKWR